MKHSFPPPFQQKILRKPSWLKVRPPYADMCGKIRSTVAGLQLHTVCQEAACPNMAECFQNGTATFLILGNICTRHCLYCNVAHGVPARLDPLEIDRLVNAVRLLNLRYVVVTSVTRDDLPDGGAQVFADCIAALRRDIPGCRLEVLIPDFSGNFQALEKVMDAAPDVINHNMEVVEPFFPKLRPGGHYRTSLNLLYRVAQKPLVSKSGFMVGFGESQADILRLIDDLASVSCARLTIGQYQQPSLRHWPVAKYYTPEEFARFKEIAYAKGFQHVEAGPLVRSSYRAGDLYPPSQARR
jgi:lipoic acid synthetase